ncbi:MAG: hypothetical protein KAU28_08495, partial [Phycisphaerae bacterium]|nr:hypothetical protein [Phycisphaerae bacterium]
GRSVTLAVPLADADNDAWRQSPQLGELLAAAAQWAARPGPDSRFTGEVSREADKLKVRILAADADGPMNLLQLAARIELPSRPAAEPRLVGLRQLAPGTYEAQTRIGVGPLGVFVADEQSGSVVWRSALAASYPREFSRIGANWENLRRLAKLTGGRIARRGELATLTAGLRARGYRPLWAHLLAAAVAMMLLDWSLTHIRRRRKQTPAGEVRRAS